VGELDWVTGVHSDFGFKRKRILPVGDDDGAAHTLGEGAATYYIED